jgi:geranylgeranyl diphosphate synthase type I
VQHLQDGALVGIIEAHLARTLERYRGPSPIYEMVRYHFGYDGSGSPKSGKRLRPQLLLRTALAEGGLVECAIDAAVAIEILHNYSLVHDDIEDGDELRHGRTTIWARYGVAQGINAGDALCAISYLTLLHEEAVVPPNRVVEMLNVLHEANLLMCEGQSLDISFETSSTVGMEQYLEMIGGKTGALFAASCELGALAAGAEPSRAREYARLGRAYGLAFQIRDDVLGTWGSSEVTGKPSGADIARRKWSFPVVWALDTGPSADREVVARAYARQSRLDAEGVSAVIGALDRLGARAAADDAHDRALDDADRIAGHASIDVQRTIRDFLAQGARRVA